MRKVNFVHGVLLVFGLATAVCAEAEPVKGSTSQRLDSIEAKLQPLYAKAGIYFGGNFYSRALSSKLSGNVTDSATAKTTENVLYTGLDLTLNARPLDAIGGTAIVRMYQDWRNMFGSMANPLTLRWISIDGNAKNFFTYNVGDFSQKYSKYTVWTPEPEIMFEPTIFARQRDIAMGEEFLGDNNRILQGTNFNFGAKFAPALQEFKIGGFAARLRQAGKELGVGDPGTPQGVDSWKVDMDRYAVAANADITFVKGTQIGGTFLYIGDAKRTSKEDDSTTWTKANKDAVFSGRARLGSEMFSGIDADKVNFGLNGEFAGSNYTVYPSYNEKTQKGVERKRNGTAFKGNLDGTFKFGRNGLNIDAGFLNNEQGFRNELAQSPALFNRKILNSMNPNLKFNVFDALYTSVFSYMPAGIEVNESLVPAAGVKQPIKKSAWTRGTLTWQEIRDAYNNGLLEKNISETMPLGEATPNRSGIIANLKLDFLNKAILLGGDFKLLNELNRDTIYNPYTTLKKQEFMEFTGGASFDVAKFGNWWAYPFILSGSFKQTSVNNYLGIPKQTNDIMFINGGAYWKFWKRAAIMGGYQLVGSEAKVTVGGGYYEAGSGYHKLDEETKAYKITTNQSQWAAGFEYTVAEGAVLNATIGQITVDYSASDRNVKKDMVKDNYKSLRLDLNLSVKF